MKKLSKKEKINRLNVLLSGLFFYKNVIKNTKLKIKGSEFPFICSLYYKLYNSNLKNDIIEIWSYKPKKSFDMWFSCDLKGINKRIITIEKTIKYINNN